eukprot:3835063-Amphidinium_carterae.1
MAGAGPQPPPSRRGGFNAQTTSKQLMKVKDKRRAKLRQATTKRGVTSRLQLAGAPKHASVASANVSKARRSAQGSPEMSNLDRFQ